MNERLARAEALFHEALELSAEERETFLRKACGEDAELLREVTALLNASGVADEWLKETDCTAVGDPGRISEGPGAVIGRYKLLEKIGEGGFGVVYMAQQEQPVRRRVALKIIKLGMDTRSVIARFEAERQALALMDHPNIAKVLDAGATETGRPFFVMELVRGVPVTKFCEDNQLGIHQRLELFIQVCGAIQHAHQKGIIHRDIKPTNVLVTLNDGLPHPMVIDFGVAKAINQRLTEKTLFTNFAQMIGTPAYMSPEQAEMSKLDVDTRSDIYSLGVLLYELLTGTTPFSEERLRSAGYAEMQRIICEEDPERPSTRLTKSLEGRASSPAASVTRRIPQSKIDRDLDRIVVKCLEKDRTRRYDSASGLAADLKHFLNNEPVMARPPNNLYRLKKLIRRNQLAFAAVAAVAATLLLGIIGSTWQALRATRAEREQSLLREQAEKARAQAEFDGQKAKTEAAKSRHVADFMKLMLEGVGPSTALGRDTTMLREILDKTEARLGEGLKDEPAVEAELRHTIGQVYFALGELNKAEQMHRESLAIRRTLHGQDDLDVADSLEALAWVILYQGETAQAATLLREVLTIRTKLLGNAHTRVARSLYHLALASPYYPDVDEIEALHRDALTTRRKLLGEEHPDIALLLDGLGTVLRIQGKFQEAEALHRQALNIHRKLLGENHVEVAQSLDSLIAALIGQNKLSEAESVCQEKLTIHRKLYCETHPQMASALQTLGRVLARQGKLAEAEDAYHRVLVIHRALYRDEHPDVAFSLERLGELASSQHKIVEAENLYRQAVAIRKKTIARDQSSISFELRKVVAVLDEQGVHRQVLTLETNLPQLKLADSLKMLARILREQGKLTEAEAFSRECLSIREKQLPDDWLTFDAQRVLGSNLLAQQRYAEAEPLLCSACEGLQKCEARIPSHSRRCLTESVQHLIHLYEATGRPQEAHEWKMRLAPH